MSVKLLAFVPIPMDCYASLPLWTLTLLGPYANMEFNHMEWNHNHVE